MFYANEKLNCYGFDWHHLGCKNCVCISRDGGIGTKMLASASFQNRWEKKI